MNLSNYGMLLTTYCSNHSKAERWKATLATALNRSAALAECSSSLFDFFKIFCLFLCYFFFFFKAVLPFLTGQLIFMSAVATWWKRAMILAMYLALRIWGWQCWCMGSSLKISDGAFSRATSFFPPQWRQRPYVAKEDNQGGPKFNDACMTYLKLRIYDGDIEEI